MQPVRIQLTVNREMSREFVRLDMSKPCDSHAIIMRKELRGAALWGGRASTANEIPDVENVGGVETVEATGED